MRFLVLSALVLGACGPSRVCRTPDAPPTYNTDIKPIASVKCENCHSAKVKGADRHGTPDEDNYESYAKITTNASKEDMMNDIEKDVMPLKNMGQPDLTPAEKDVFLQWLYCGQVEK